MPNREIKLHLEWLEKANEDKISIEAIIKEGASGSTACFLSQQMAEKHLKALLSYYHKIIPRVHDLLQLETLLLEDEVTVINIHEELDILNRYYIETRYPGDFGSFTLSEAKKAYKAACRVKDYVFSIINAR